MSYNEPNVEKAASRHRPAIWAIGFAVLAAVIAGIVFAPWRGDGTQQEVVPPAVTGPAGDTPAPGTNGTAPAETGG